MVAIVLPLLFAAVAYAACYFPDGSLANDTPCTNLTSHSTCCGTGYACLGHTSAFFLCEATTPEQLTREGSAQFIRGSCTDSTFRSGNCPNVCNDPKRDHVKGGNGVAQCPRDDAAVYYCISPGLGVENCSANFNTFGFYEKPSVLTTIGVIQSVIPSTSALTFSTMTTRATAKSPTDGSTSPPRDTAPPPPSCSPDDKKTGIIVGVIIGSVGAFTGIIALYYLFKMKRRYSELEAMQESQKQSSGLGITQKRQAGDPDFSSSRIPSASS